MAQYINVDNESPTKITSSENLLSTLAQTESIYRFVITGGPCAGKTTAMERLQVFLRERGFRVFVVPEAATMLFTNGASPADLANVKCEEAFQDFVINTQLQLENSMTNYAVSVGTKAVILCDRGIMDGSAYVTDEIWQGVLERANSNIVSAREGRYDAVFHLVTAADGAEPFYSLANNAARHESISEAINQDRKTQMAWHGHPHHVIIDNRDNRTFERKMELLVQMLSNFVGLPSLTRRSHKYPLLAPPDINQLPNVQIFTVEKIMLEKGVGAAPTARERRARASSVENVFSSSSDATNTASSVTVSNEDVGMSLEEDKAEDEEGSGDQVLYSFIRKRSISGFDAYGLTTVKMLSTGEQVELKQVITKRMYQILSNSADPSRDVVHQRRYCFQWERQSFHVYEYLGSRSGIWVCLCQSESAPKIPPFLHVGPEGSMGFSSRDISRKDLPSSPSPLGHGNPNSNSMESFPLETLKTN